MKRKTLRKYIESRGLLKVLRQISGSFPVIAKCGFHRCNQFDTLCASCLNVGVVTRPLVQRLIHPFSPVTDVITGYNILIGIFLLMPPHPHPHVDNMLTFVV